MRNFKLEMKLSLILLFTFISCTIATIGKYRDQYEDFKIKFNRVNEDQETEEARQVTLIICKMSLRTEFDWFRDFSM